MQKQQHQKLKQHKNGRRLKETKDEKCVPSNGTKKKGHRKGPSMLGSKKKKKA